MLPLVVTTYPRRPGREITGPDLIRQEIFSASRMSITGGSSMAIELADTCRKYGDYATAKHYLDQASFIRGTHPRSGSRRTRGAHGTGRIYRSRHEHGLLHAIVHTFVVVDDEAIYLQRKAATRAVSPMRWTSSSCGHVRHGETPRATAGRELLEELGIGSPNNLSEIGRTEALTVETNGYRCRARAHIFCLRLSRPLDQGNINPHEIHDLRLVRFEEIEKMLTGEQEPLDFADNFPTIYRRFAQSFRPLAREPHREAERLEKQPASR